MNSLKDTALESNPYLRINFDGGDLSSDAGLLLINDIVNNGWHFFLKQNGTYAAS